MEEPAAFGVGFTVITKLVDGPEQLFADGVTVIVAVIAALVLLVAVKEAILPLPLAPRPIAVLLFVQLYDVPVPLNVTAVVDILLHTV